ncbi:hypothetical protein GF406_07150 [candidate division KSB1 bacterium]|nr:hypothetical protein [candidate division KSB1 bacterium]
MKTRHSMFFFILASVAPIIIHSQAFCSSACLMTNPSPNTKCETTDKITWLNPPEHKELYQSTRTRYDDLINDPSFTRGIWTAGDAHFQLDSTEPQYVEIFMLADDGGLHGFTLLENGEPIDTLQGITFDKVRLRPKGIRTINLLGIVKGNSKLTVKTTSPGWVMSAIRMTPQNEFETQLIPEYLERARKFEDPFFEGKLNDRQRPMDQLWSRLMLSETQEIRQEALLGATRASYWYAVENHEPLDIQKTNMLLSALAAEIPEHPITRQMISASYLNQNLGSSRYDAMGTHLDHIPPVPWSIDLATAPENAPAWAVAQRRVSARLNEITGWWVNERQLPDGQLGGGWGDDVEILRHWIIQAAGLGSLVAAKGVKNVADGLWYSDEIENGYNAEIRDVEHSAEPTSDTEPYLAALYPDDAQVLERLAMTTDCLSHWLTEQPDGFWRFGSSWFNCTELDTTNNRDLDVFFNLRAVGPALWYAYLTQNEDLIHRLSLWGESWVKAMRSTDHGKPAGIFPSAMESKTGNYLIRSDEWDKPDAEWDYFQWSGRSQEVITSFMLGLYELTGDSHWLDIAEKSFSVMNECKTYPDLCKTIRENPESFYLYRQLANDSTLDSAFGVTPDPDRAQILDRMAQQAQEMEALLGVNLDMWTTEVMYTDRVYYRFPPEYVQHLFGGTGPRGDRVPSFAVTWLPEDTDIARAVLGWSESTLITEFYNFSTKQELIGMRLWQLEPGTYRWTLNSENGTVLDDGQLQIQNMPHKAEFTIPPQQSVTLFIIPQP